MQCSFSIDVSLVAPDAEGNALHAPRHGAAVQVRLPVTTFRRCTQAMLGPWGVLIAQFTCSALGTDAPST